MKKILHRPGTIIMLLPMLLNISCKKIASAFAEPDPCYTCPCTACLGYKIGDNVLGGKVAYIFQSSDFIWNFSNRIGIIVSLSDQSSGAEWGCTGTSITGADSTGLLYGDNNTTDIIAGCATAGIAARVCRDLSLGGYYDWVLPSKDELNKLYLNKALIGGFRNNPYWSSSENGNDKAWNQNFANGAQGDSSKNKIYYVRAIRYY